MPRVIFLGAVIVLTLWVGFGHHPSSHRHWALPNHDTVEIITEVDQRSYMVNDRSAPTRYLWIQFRSPLKDTAHDRRDAEAIIELVCRAADSLGYRHIRVDPTTTVAFNLVKFSLGTRWFAVESPGHCSPERLQ